MKYSAILITLALVASVANAARHRIKKVKEKEVKEKEFADTCSEDNCKLADKCLCASGTSPIDTVKTPQFIVMTFDDAVTTELYQKYYSKLLTPARKNPDGSNIKATFFVPHEFTDYKAVYDLYIKGHEIGVHSISKNPEAEYWNKANLTTLIDEFVGQKEIISKFANIPKEHLAGVRTPFLQLAKDTSFTAYKQANFTYDSSWPAFSNAKLFPFSLKYYTEAPCPLGSCPEESYDDMWVSPINNIKGVNNVECNVIYSCGSNRKKKQIKKWLHEQLQISFKDKRTPFNILLNSVWFSNMNGTFDALQEFIDEVLVDNFDFFFVTQRQLIEWMKSPVEVDEFSTENTVRKTNCRPKTCTLMKNEADIRYMKSCVTCPVSYPWLGNHLGDKVEPKDDEDEDDE